MSFPVVLTRYFTEAIILPFSGVSCWKVTKWVPLQASVIAESLETIWAALYKATYKGKRKRGLGVFSQTDQQRRVARCQMHGKVLILLQQPVGAPWSREKFLLSH